jgi:hypothetical protein
MGLSAPPAKNFRIAEQSGILAMKAGPIANKNIANSISFHLLFIAKPGAIKSGPRFTRVYGGLRDEERNASVTKAFSKESTSCGWLNKYSKIHRNFRF